MMKDKRLATQIQIKTNKERKGKSLLEKKAKWAAQWRTISYIVLVLRRLVLGFIGMPFSARLVRVARVTAQIAMLLLLLLLLRQ